MNFDCANIINKNSSARIEENLNGNEHNGRNNCDINMSENNKSVNKK